MGFLLVGKFLILSSSVIDFLTWLSLTARWICWDEPRYIGVEAVEWRTCILQAAGNATGPIKESAESFVLLCVKASTWCTEIVSADLQGRKSDRDLSVGYLSKVSRVFSVLLLPPSLRGSFPRFTAKLGYEESPGR